MDHPGRQSVDLEQVYTPIGTCLGLVNKYRSVWEGDLDVIWNLDVIQGVLTDVRSIPTESVSKQRKDLARIVASRNFLKFQARNAFKTHPNIPLEEYDQDMTTILRWMASMYQNCLIGLE